MNGIVNCYLLMTSESDLSVLYQSSSIYLRNGKEKVCLKRLCVTRVCQRGLYVFIGYFDLLVGPNLTPVTLLRSRT